MKQWVKKLLDQFTIDWGNGEGGRHGEVDITEDRATLLYILDVYNKHLLDIEKQPVRKVRETLDGFAKDLVTGREESSDALFRLRQFFSSYRIDEYTFIQNTLDDFKKIVWDFADQLSEEIKEERVRDDEVEHSLDALREAVESNSIEALRAKSKEFIEFYIRHHAQKDDKRTKRMHTIRRNLNTVKKKLVQANHSMMVDHLTQAFNRRSFDEQMEHYCRLFTASRSNITLLVFDIDYFKRINDTFGHDVGDFVLKECVGTMKSLFSRESDFVARIGGEEFAVLLPDYDVHAAISKAEEALQRIRKEAVVTGPHTIRFTVSIGIAQLEMGETGEQWLKRADEALYKAKHSGRDRAVVANHHEKKNESVA